MSVGWATDQDALAGVSLLTVREFRGVLKAAVAEAKVKRDCVVRFLPAHLKAQMRSGRADCAECYAKFDLRIPISDTRVEAMQCPNCGAEVERPVGLKPV